MLSYQKMRDFVSDQTVCEGWRKWLRTSDSWESLINRTGGGNLWEGMIWLSDVIGDCHLEGDDKPLQNYADLVVELTRSKDGEECECNCDNCYPQHLRPKVIGEVYKFLGGDVANLTYEYSIYIGDGEYQRDTAGQAEVERIAMDTASRFSIRNVRVKVVKP